MTTTNPEDPKQPIEEELSTFEREAAEGDQPGIVGEFFGFLRENALWWLMPIMIVFGLLGILLALGATGVAPFLYTLW